MTVTRELLPDAPAPVHGPSRAPAPAPGPRTWRERRRDAHHARLMARLVELESIARVLTDAAVRVHEGWCQDTWTALSATGRDVCLVSAIRVCGPSAGADPDDQVANRAIDTAWHTLHHDAEGMRWAPDPGIRLTRVRDLARWNDRLERSTGDVSALLGRSATTADDEAWRLRREYFL